MKYCCHLHSHAPMHAQFSLPPGHRDHNSMMKVPPSFSSTICAVTQVVAYEMTRDDFYDRVVVPFHKMGLAKQANKSVRARKAFHSERLHNELTKRNTDTTGLYGTLNGEAAKTPALPETNKDDGSRNEFSKTFKAVIKLHNHLIDNENNVHEREWAHSHKHLQKGAARGTTEKGTGNADVASSTADISRGVSWMGGETPPSATVASGNEAVARKQGEVDQDSRAGEAAWPRLEMSEEEREAVCVSLR